MMGLTATDLNSVGGSDVFIHFSNLLPFPPVSVSGKKAKCDTTKTTMTATAIQFKHEPPPLLCRREHRDVGGMIDRV